MGHDHCDAAAVSNVSLSHEAPLAVLRQHPESLLDLLQIAGRRERSAGNVVVEILDSEFTEATPSVRNADLVVLLCDEAGEPQEVIVLEIQRRVVAEKLFAWPLYLAYLHAHHRVPATLLVLTFDAAVATWARESRPVGPNLQCTPWVIGPGDLPEIASVEQALAHPELSLLTALTHLGSRAPSRIARHEAEIIRVFEAMLRTEDPAMRRLYVSLLHGTARGSLRATLERLKEECDMGAVEMIFEEGRAEGKAKGKAEGKAEGEATALLKILQLRGLEVDAAAEARIRETRSLDLLDRWLERALTATTVRELLAD